MWRRAVLSSQSSLHKLIAVDREFWVGVGAEFVQVEALTLTVG